MYSKEQVKGETLKYFKGDELAADKWIKKYCLRNERGELLEQSPDDMHRRLAREFARIEKNYKNPLEEEQIYQLLKDFQYIVPGGSQMSGIGNSYQFTSLSNCFVIDSPIDSYGGIFRADEEQVQIMKRRGGVGHDLSNLRPAGTIANNSILGGLAGSTLYMERYSNSTREVAQDGRRGALMLSMDVRHPDIDRFIDMKLESGKVTGANISVKITDDFMGALEEGEDFIQSFPINGEVSGKGYLYDILHKSDYLSGTVYSKKINPKRLWDKIVKNAWQSAEPGVLFWDIILRESPAGCYGEEWKETSTNPCGEIPLCPYDSCRLTALNLYSFVVNPFTKNAYFNFLIFKDVVRKAQRLMDDLIDLEIEKIDLILNKIESDPEPDDIKQVERELWMKIREKAVQGRRTGLGITAEADMLAALGFRYGTEEATKFSEEVHRVMAVESYKSSIEMAEERGYFPIFDEINEHFNPFINRVFSELEEHYREKYMMFGRRNIANLTIAPTGTVSLMTQSTSGIEPLFQPFYKRRTKIEDRSKATFIDEVGDAWNEYFVIHPKFVEWFVRWNELGLTYEEAKRTLEIKTEQELNIIFESSPYYKATANDIDWKASVEMQGRIQKWIDHSISKTVNVPKEATVETVDEIYRTAYKSGCKGVTIYRDGSRQGVMLIGKEENKDKFQYSRAFKRPQKLECDIYRKTALKQSWMVVVGKVDDNPYEIFAIKDVENHLFPFKIEKGYITKVKSRHYELDGILQGKTYKINNILDLMSDDERVDTRKYSSMLRHGMHPRYIAEQIDEYATIVSFDKVVQRVLKMYVEDQEKEKCPECGSDKYHAESGCYSCPDCGYAKCG